MKKNYNQPAVLISKIATESMILAGSGDNGYNLQNNSLGIGMGGISGDQIPQ